jgi:Tfp pilus assembly protein PilO
MLIIVPIVVILVYWFLILSPKRDDLKKAQSAQTAAEQARDQAVAQAAQLQKAKSTFAADYAAVVRLGKAIPETVDSPSLLVQLDRASKGTHIAFRSVSFGGRSSTTVAVAPTSAPSQPGGNAAAGGAPASTGLGGATESAGNAVNKGNAASGAVDQASGGTSTTTTTTTTTPATGGAAPTSASLDTVPLTFNFVGSYFDLADFLHRLKRFVYVANSQIFVRGRLLTIDSVAFAPGGATAAASRSGIVTATIGATVYLAPKAQGTTAGATPAGPAGTPSGQTSTTPSGSETSSVPLATAGVR